ncbi:MAG: glycosyltransferase family 39 protein [Solirubrobacterales bacterium]|nr:glycosyltransferase family 39 protein [Solirubrobacterales bacterium]
MSTTTLPRRVSPVQDLAGGRLRLLVRGRADDPAWARPALLGLLIATAVAYLWNLTASGEANSFYAAAVQAMTKSWKAFFFGSLDSSNFITVDKPPASLWVMALSGRLFGFSSASMLVPQVLEGVVAVGLLAASVKRWFGAGAGLLAGGLLAATPAAALMFRFNNPDALLVCLLVGSAYCLVRALEGASSRWILAVGALIGFAFLAKMMQAFLVVPGFALVYLIAAPTSVRRRVGQLLAAGAAMVLSAGWWATIVALWPVSSRPMIDGSPDNSILNLIFGYNGFGRLTGAGGGGGFSGQSGLLRLFNDLMGGQASWMLPAALIILGAGLVWRLRAPRTDRVRAALLLWGGWLVVTGLVFSLASGVIHTYYTVALAPAIAALVAIGVALVWRRREQPAARALLAVGVGVTAAWSLVLLGRTSTWEPWLTPVVAVAGVSAVAALLAPPPMTRRVRTVGALLALVACLVAPVAYSAQTIASPHTGSVPSAGPEIASANGFGGRAPGGTRPAGAGPGGGAGETSSALISLLKEGASGYRWAAATYGSQSAGSLELATGGVTVMAIGGFDGQGGNLSLAQFEAYVRAGEIHYFVMSGGGAGTGGPGGGAGTGGPGGGAGTGGPGGGSTTSAITSWVEAHYKAETVGGQTVYDLSQPTS